MRLQRSSEPIERTCKEYSMNQIRHPFVRIVSAFCDKFELGAKNNWIYKMYAADVLDIPEASADKTEAYMRNIYRKIVNLPRPSFSQFVEYLLRTKVENYNDHWLQYWLLKYVWATQVVLEIE